MNIAELIKYRISRAWEAYEEGIVTKESGKTFNRLFNLRHEGDYADFIRLTEEDISPFINETKMFITEVESLIHNDE